MNCSELSLELSIFRVPECLVDALALVERLRQETIARGRVLRLDDQIREKGERLGSFSRLHVVSHENEKETAADFERHRLDHSVDVAVLGDSVAGRDHDRVVALLKAEDLVVGGIELLDREPEPSEDTGHRRR